MSLHSPAGGYLCYFKFVHSSTQTKPYISRISFRRMLFGAIMGSAKIAKIRYL